MYLYSISFDIYFVFLNLYKCIYTLYTNIKNIINIILCTTKNIIHNMQYLFNNDVPTTQVV